MKRKAKIAHDLLVEVIGSPWNGKKFGLPYLRFEDSSGAYLGVPKYRELLKLKNRIDYCIKCEKESRATKQGGG